MVRHKQFPGLLLTVLFILICSMYPQKAIAGQVTLEWDRNTEPEVVGYKIYYGTASRSYSGYVDAGDVNRCTVSNLVDGKTYYFAATAYDRFGNQSDYSAEISVSLPSVPPGVSSSNHTPTAQDGSFMTAEETSFSGRLSGQDADGDVLEYVKAGAPKLGTLTFWNASTGDFTYKPFTDQVGEDQFGFYVADGKSSSSPALVKITIQSFNDAPWAEDMETHVFQDNQLAGVLKAGDMENDPLRYSICQKPSMGTVQLVDAAKGTFTYIPAKDFVGRDAFQFVVNDGSLDSRIATVVVMVHEPVKLLVEAEKGELNAPAAIFRDPSASGGEYIDVPVGPSPTLSAVSGSARYAIEIPVSGNYYLWVRVRTPQISHNGLAVAWDFQNSIQWYPVFTGSSQWAWNGISEHTGAPAEPFHLESGSHLLTLECRAGEGAMDQVMITTNPNPFGERILEEAEDGSAARWHFLNNVQKSNPPVNVFEENRAGNTIYFSGTSFNRDCWSSLDISAVPSGAIYGAVKWSSKSSSDFGVILDVETKYGPRYLVYLPIELKATASGDFVMIGLGTGAGDNRWHSFLRKIEEDLQLVKPDNRLLGVKAIHIYGRGWLDDLSLIAD